MKESAREGGGGGGDPFCVVLLKTGVFFAEKKDHEKGTKELLLD